MNYKSHIPNFITLLNLLCGGLAVIFLFKGFILEAAMLVGLSAVFDFFDGLAAKLLNAKSLIGKELDSLADVISFGLVPSLFVFILMEKNIADDASIWIKIIPYFSLTIAGFSALRLAKFNLDTRQSVYFIGFPTPANAILLISFSIVALLQSDTILGNIFSNLYVQLLLIGITCFLLVSEIRMFALKFKGLSFKANRIRYTFLLIALLLIVFLGWTGLVFSIFTYILMSLIFKE